MQSINNDNNFGLLRIIAAVFVFWSHSYAVYGYKEYELLSSDLFHGITMGTLGVSMFFSISGFLITVSWLKTNNLNDYLKKRLLRVYPGLFFNVFITVILFGVLSTSLEYKDYFASIPLLPTIALAIFLEAPNLPGVFKDNPFPYLVNSSLWTLKFELLCYFLIMVLGCINSNLRIIVLRFGVLFAFYMMVWNRFFPVNVLDLLYLHFFSFFLGAALFLYFDKNTLTNHRYAIVFASLLLTVFIWDLYATVVYIVCTALLTTYMAIATKKINISKYGDLSYGIYIYAWPIQQLVGQKFNFKEEYFLYYMSISFIITILFAFISWHLVEKRFIALGRRKTTK